MIIEELRHSHIVRLIRQGNLGEQHPDVEEMLIKPTYLDDLIKHGPAMAGVVDEGVVAAMGMVKQSESNYRCWAVTDRRLTSRYLIRVCRAMRFFMDKQNANRIETIVQVGNACGEHWVRLLGFTEPHLMRRYNQYGDAYLYERIK